MSRMMLRSNGKPPLARSPVRPPPRRKALQPTNPNTVQTPSGSVAKPQLPTNPVWAPDLRPEYDTISRELQALAKMVHQELGDNDDTSMADCDAAPVCPPLFERGRFYDEYSARRNERLKRKKCEMEKKPCYDLGVRFDSAKRRDSGVKVDGRRKSMVAAAATPVVERRQGQTPRYSLRSSVAVKENRKPPLPVPIPSMSSVGVTARKVGIRKNMKGY